MSELQDKISLARKDAEALKAKIKNYKDELNDTERTFQNYFL
jgi:uncharacterized protein YlxW (UPF0749 family)